MSELIELLKEYRSIDEIGKNVMHLEYDGFITFMPTSDLNNPQRDIPIKLEKKGMSAYMSKHFIQKDEEIILAKKQAKSIIETNESVKNTNESIVAVNESIERLNEIIIPNFNKSQRRLSISTIIVAAVSFVAIAISAYESSTVPTSKQYELTNKLLIQQQKILESMQKVQTGIDSSLRTMATKKTDTFFLKHQ